MVLVVVALAGGLAWISTLPLAGDHDPGANAGASFASGTTGIAIGERAPDFLDARGVPSLTGLDGEPVRLADFAGSPLWIVFWATSCPPCEQEAADIVALSHAHRDDGLIVLAIDVQEPASSVEDFVKAHHIDYRIGLDATAAIRDQYGWGLPFHYFLDENAVIRERHFGQMSAPTMEEALQTILRRPG